MKTDCIQKLFFAWLLACSAPLVLAQGVSDLVPGSGGQVAAQLVAEPQAAVPGESLWVAVRLVHDANWHTYWKNPGDAGKPTEISWQLPPAMTAGDIVWPLPERFDLPADLVDFGYTREIFLLTELQVPADTADSPLTLRADVQWLECEEICIPGGASVSLTLPVAFAGQTVADPRWAAGFAATRENQPRADISLDATFSISGENINLLVQATEPIFEAADTITFIPDTHRVLDYIADQAITSQLSSLQLSQKAHARALREPPPRVGGLLIVDSAGVVTAYDVEAAPDGVSMAALDNLGPAAGSTRSDMSLFTVFLFALAGGLILNLMPCVFPVLSLKAMSLASNAGAPAREQRLHGIAYAGGVILSFLVLAGILLSLQAGGALIGWGFQLQSPWFVAALVYLFFLMGLAMSGVVEIGTGIMGVGSGLTEREGYTGSFFTGVLASVVASPCTAPFMGTALGFALTQSMPMALTVFVALGFGMSLPFLVFSFVPALTRMLPRPGHWMLTFRQFLAFPLYAAAVWLLWVLGSETSVDAMGLVAISCVLIGLASWLYQKESKSNWRWLEVAIIIACIIGVFSVLGSPMLKPRQAAATVAAGENFEAYSDARLSELRSSGQPVFVNMTASWCITCLVNERVALSSDAVIQAMADNGVTYLKGDWTNNDPAITEVLKRFETSGVPLYLMYPADPSRPPEVLPQILTENILLDALGRL